MKKIFLFIGIIISVMACVTEVDFESEDSQFIAVSGVISNNPQERRITFFENQTTSDAITGKLYKNGEFEADLLAVQRRTLELPTNLIIEEGASYHIEIEKSNGDLYRTEPQEVLKPRKPEGVKTIVLEQTYQLDNGAFSDGFGINVLAEMSISDQTNPYFLRFQMNEAWQYQEVEDVRAGTEDSVVNTCYIIKNVREFPSQVWSSAGQNLGLQDAFVANRLVDDSFLLQHYFNIYVYTISPEAFTYYDNVKKISENTGTLLDEIPAAIPGNVFKVNDDKQIVYGFVEFALPDTIRTFVNGIENVNVPNNCAGPEPCIPPRPFIGLPECACADCLLIDGATYNRPAYFQ